MPCTRSGVELICEHGHPENVPPYRDVNIDPSASKEQRFLFNDAPWIGGKHDGYPLLGHDEYYRHRVSKGVRDDTFLRRAALLQCQFTFGLLEAVMEQKIPESRLLKVVGGKTYLTGDNIFGMMVDWFKSIREVTDADANRAWGDRVAAALTWMNVQLRKELQNGDIFNPCLPPLPPDELFLVIASFGAIGEIVINTAMISFRRGSKLGDKKYSWHFVNKAKFASPQMKRMVSNGWCPFTVVILAEISISSFAYCRNKRPFEREGFDHRLQCTPKECKINNINTDTYKTLHAKKSCTCPFVIPPHRAIEEVLSKGEIPVVSYDSRNFKITVESSTRGSVAKPYIAISHVWIDGLGSRTEEGLPACQLRRLANSAGALRSEISKRTARRLRLKLHGLAERPTHGFPPKLQGSTKC